MRDILTQIEQHGAGLVVVGNGTPAMLDAFVERFGAGLDAVYTDPERRVYEALEARRGRLLFALDPRFWRGLLRAVRRGAWPGRVQGDAAQLGGVWVARAGADVVFEHRSAVAGDHPSNATILQALAQLG